MTTYFIAWQDPEGRAWFPIGRVTRENGQFHFVYTKGAEEANRSAGFQALRSFPDFHEAYVSDSLFPLLSNRLPSPSRPDFTEYMSWLDLPHDTRDPLVILSRSGGKRTTDSFEVFPLPEPNEQGEYHIRFFAHGLRHFPEASAERVAKLTRGDKLMVAWDWQNPYDPAAMLLRTHDAFDGDRHLVGYCPRYLAKDVLAVGLRSCDENVDPRMTVSVERVNLPPAPLQVRLLCALKAYWPERFQPLSSPEYEPIAVADQQD